MTKNEKLEAETTLKEARLLMDFLEEHGGPEDLKIVIPSETCSDDDLEGLADGARVLGQDGDSVEMVHDAAWVIRLKYYKTSIRACMLGDGSLWFDPFDFQQFRNPQKNLLKDVEAALQKLLALEATDGAEYVAVFDDGKFLFSFDGLRTLTEANGWVAEFCSWLESLLGFIEREGFCGEGLEFSINYC